MTTGTACRVCGADDHQCGGNAKLNSRQIITANGVVRTAAPLRLPRQRATIGTPGYIGNVETYEPRNPRIKLVDPSEAAHEAQDADPQDGAGEAGEAATAQAGEEQAATAGAPAKERKPRGGDKARKDGSESK